VETNTTALQLVTFVATVELEISMVALELKTDTTSL
jgi:hypothetical protein